MNSSSRLCSRCDLIRPLTDFPKSKADLKGHYRYCKPCHRRLQKARILNNPQKKALSDSLYYQRNKETIRAYKCEWAKTQRATNIQYRIKANLRNRLKLALKGKCKLGSHIEFLGCGILELKTHLELKFQNGMNWDNYGKWEIDHILPLARFDLTNLEQLKIVCNYNNLQPLWKIDNMKKGAKVIY